VGPANQSTSQDNPGLTPSGMYTNVQQIGSETSDWRLISFGSVAKCRKLRATSYIGQVSAKAKQTQNESLEREKEYCGKVGKFYIARSEVQVLKEDGLIAKGKKSVSCHLSHNVR
jgi:hypothetical protein